MTTIEWTDTTRSRSGCGEANPNWRGGRTVTPAGYVLRRVPEHPAADVRGYVYEHRLVMEDMLGRALQPGERVRHKDGDPGNNSPTNLLLMAPLDRDEEITCECGCGTGMKRLDSSGRRRRFVSGHNGRRGCRAGRRPKSEVGTAIAKDRREGLLELFRALCAYGCGRPATCWDHVIPWSEGGSFKMPGNAVPACRPCNLQKGAGDLVEVWEWIDRGVRSDQSDAWESVIALALSWGALDFPAEPEPAAVTA
jgi:hypothetical protein